MWAIELGRIVQFSGAYRSLADCNHVKVHDKRSLTLKLRRTEKVRRQCAPCEPYAFCVARRTGTQHVQVKLHSRRLRETTQKIYILLLNKKVAVSNRYRSICARPEPQGLNFHAAVIQ